MKQGLQGAALVFLPLLASAGYVAVHLSDAMRHTLPPLSVTADGMQALYQQCRDQQRQASKSAARPAPGAPAVRREGRTQWPQWRGQAEEVVGRCLHEGAQRSAAAPLRQAREPG